MKKLLLIPALLAMFGFTVPAEHHPEALQTSLTKQQFKVVPRGTIIDDSGNYRVYIDSDPGYDGNFSGGNVTIVVQNLSTSAFYSTISKLGYITSTNWVGQSAFSPNFAKCRFIENGATQEIFFVGQL